MTKISRSGMVRWIMLLVIPVLIAASLPPEFAKLESTYLDTIRRIQDESESAYAVLGKTYIANLSALETSLQKAGKLEPLLAARTERGRFEASRQLQTTDLSETSAELRQVQQQHLDAIAALPLKKAQSIMNLLQQYDKALASLQESLTKKNDLETAILIKAQRDATQARAEVTSARFIVETAEANQPPAPPPAAEPAKPAPTLRTPTAKQPAEPPPKFTGSPERYIKNRYEAFFKALQAQNWEEASTYIDPETLQRRGLDVVTGRLRMYYGILTMGGNPAIKVEPDDVTISKETSRAQLTLRGRVDNRIIHLPGVTWMEVDGDWFIDINQAPAPAAQQPPMHHRR